jgi:DNA-binding NtrC family response regulator
LFNTIHRSSAEEVEDVMGGTRKLRVILVDDDATVTRIAEKNLQTAFPSQISLAVFNDPRAAHQAIDEAGCDLLLSDIQMPGLSGLEMLRFAKARNAWTQVIFMTGHSTWDHIAAAIESGAADYLIKPLDRDDFLRVVGQACERIVRWQNAVRITWQPPAAVG